MALTLSKIITSSNNEQLKLMQENQVRKKATNPVMTS